MTPHPADRGDQRARVGNDNGAAHARALVERNLPLIRQVVASMSARFPKHADREELVSAATLGLVEAATRYDDQRGVPFEPWAMLRMRGAVLDAVRGLDFAPRSVRGTARAVEEQESRLTHELGRVPTSAEVAVAAGMSVGELAELQKRVFTSLVLRLDAPATGERESSTLADGVSDGGAGDPVSVLEQREERAYLHAALAALPDRLRDVVNAYFFGGESSEAIAERMGVTESRVSQMRTQALGLIRMAMSAQYDEKPAVPAEPRGRVERKHAAYVAAMTAQSTFRSRLAEAEVRRGVMAVGDADVRLPHPRRAIDL